MTARRATFSGDSDLRRGHPRHRPAQDGRISVLEARAAPAAPCRSSSSPPATAGATRSRTRGADYVAKPFHLEEVLARIRALLRRSAGHCEERAQLRRGSPRHPHRPRDRGRQPGRPPRTNTGCSPISCITPAAWSRAASWSSISTTRTSIATSTPSEVFVGRIRRSRRRVRSHPDRARARLSAHAAGQCVLIRSRYVSSSRQRPLVVTGIVLSSLYRAAVERAFDRRLASIRAPSLPTWRCRRRMPAVSPIHGRAAVRPAALRLVLAGDAPRRAHARCARRDRCGMPRCLRLAISAPRPRRGPRVRATSKVPRARSCGSSSTIDLGEAGALPRRGGR